MWLWIDAQRKKNPPEIITQCGSKKINMMGIAAWSELPLDTCMWHQHVYFVDPATITILIIIFDPSGTCHCDKPTFTKLQPLSQILLFAIDVWIKETICKNSGIKYTSVRSYWFKYVNKVRNWLGEHKYFQVCHPFQIWTKYFIFR